MNWQNSVLSEINADFLSNPFPAIGETITVSLRVASAAPVRRVFLQTVLAGESRLRVLQKSGSRDGYAWFNCELTVTQKRTAWHFVLETEDGDYFMYNRKTVCRFSASNDYNFVLFAGLACPHWVRSAVFYQIFPDRFFCATSADGVKDGEYRYEGHPTQCPPWNSVPKSWNEAHCLDFYGGDLDGIEKKIPYLRSLGVTAVFLNPIFTAPSVHRYDCTDYYAVDAHLGGDAALIALSAALHRQDMKIIVDVSLNHTGIDHLWMKRARSDPQSAERSFYYFDESGNPAGWEGVASLPQLNYSSAALRERICLADDSVVRHYIKKPFAIDGWRFDVGNFTGRRGAEDYNGELFRSIRRRVKDLSSEAFLLAENWTDSLEYLDGEQWDAAMNYQGSARPIRRFLGGRDRFTDPEESLAKPVRPLTGEEFAEAVGQYFARIPNQLAFVQFNLLDSHDIYRLHTFEAIVTPETLRGAIIMLYLLPGAPSIFYGDEIGLDGTMTPNEGCRYPMPWTGTEEGHSLFALYRTLNGLKRAESALQDGAFRFLYSDSDTVIAARIGARRSFISVFSRSTAPKTVTVDFSPVCLVASELTDLFSGTVYPVADGSAELKLAPYCNTLFSLSLKLF